MADRGLLERICDAEGVDLSEEPSFFAYLQHLFDELGELFRVPPALLERMVEPSEVLLWVLVVLLPLGALYLFREPLREWVELRLRRPPPQVAVAPLPAPPPDPSALLRERLAAGDGPGALQALWWLVAEGLSRRGVGRFEPEMTNREFVRSAAEMSPGWAGLTPLSRFAQSVDLLLYGGGEPSIEQVQRLVAEGEELVR